MDLDIADRMSKTTAREAFITLKDYKEDFDTNPTVSLINPSKPEFGRVAKRILDDMVKEAKAKHESLKLATNTKEA